MEINYIDLFSGAGGMSLGFQFAGFKNLFAIEIEGDYAETYKYNFPNHNLIVDDIQNLNEDMIEDIVGNTDIDVIIGGPPCQGFSLAGRIGRSFIEDKRNYLFKDFVRIVKIIKPKSFVMENVARMISHDKGNTINEIVSSFNNLGYKVKYKVLQAADFGVPQKRQRIFIVGIRDDLKQEYNFPEPLLEKKEYMSVKEAISNLPTLKNGEKSNIPNHNAMNHTNQMLKKMSFIPDGGDRGSIPEDLRPKSGDIRKYIKYNSNEPAVTITGDMRKVFHYSQNRAATPRELARLQSFPDTFIFKGKSISVQQQIGNAVPPKLALAVANSLKDSLKVKVENE